MSTTITSGTDNFNIYIEDGERVFPCGQHTHRGDYAQECWIRHNCDHPRVWQIEADWCLCVECGTSITIEPLSMEGD